MAVLSENLADAEIIEAQVIQARSELNSSLVVCVVVDGLWYGVEKGASEGTGWMWTELR